MINTISELKEILADSELSSFEMAELPILDTDEKVLVIQVNSENALSSWQVMRDKLEYTKRWPILTDFDTVYKGSLSKTLENCDFFSRFYYKEEVRKSQDINPSQIIDNSKLISIKSCLTKIEEADNINIKEYFENELSDTKRKFGCSPDIKIIENLINSGNITTFRDLEYWLFKWEIEQFEKQALQSDYNGYLDWYDLGSKDRIILLMPTINHWETLAYIHWCGAGLYNSELVIALLKYWHGKYRSELVCHHGTMLQLTTKKLPRSQEEAFELAWEQQTIAPCTTILPGISLRDHARELLNTYRWFLHEKP